MIDIAAVMEECRVRFNESARLLGTPEIDANRWEQICSEPLEDVKTAFARLRAQGPNGRKTIFTSGPVGWIDAGPVDV